MAEIERAKLYLLNNGHFLISDRLNALLIAHVAFFLNLLVAQLLLLRIDAIPLFPFSIRLALIAFT